MTYPVRPRGCGCLMVFSVFCLTVFTAAEVGLLVWLNPDWFDAAAFWRGPVLRPDVVLTPDPAARAALERQDADRDAADAARKAKADRVVLLEDLGAAADYDPARGATVTTKEQSVFEFPAGSVREAAHIRVVPIASLPDRYADQRLRVVGPVYQIFVGDQEHYQFARPIHVTLPYAPERLGEAKEENIGVFTWDGAWHPFPAVVDRQRHTVRADVTHCSPTLDGVVDTGKDVKNWAGNWETGVRQSLWYHLSYSLSSAYETPQKHFKINYGTHFEAPPGDTAPNILPPEIQPEAPNPAYPRFVVLLGEHLEFSRANLQTVHMPITGEDEFNVYLMPQDSLGESPPGGGRLFITSKWWEWDAGEPAPPVDLLRRTIRATATHELIHVAQSQAFGASAVRGRWWMETTAAYLADRFWAGQGKPTNVVRDYDMRNGDLGHNCRLLIVPMDDAAVGDCYRYASFLRWLERKDSDAVLRVLDQVKTDQDFRLPALDAIFRKEFHAPLGELIEEFAQTFYHLDMADPSDQSIVPPDAYMNSNDTWAAYESLESGTFRYVTRAAPTSPGAAGYVNLWARTEAAALPHLTVSAFPVVFDLLPIDRKPRFVVLYEPAAGADPGLGLSVASGRINSKTTGVQAPLTPFVKVDVKSPQTTYVLGDGSHPFLDNRATILLANRSLDRQLAGGALERWVLLAPAWVQIDREARAADKDPRRWKVTWHKAELKGTKAFKGYDVYRRKRGEPDSAFKLVKPEVQDESFVDEAPDDDNYAYMVRVKDVLGNESADSPSDEYTDPFQGDWKGKVTLVKGSLVEPLLAAANKIGGDMDKDESESIARVADPDEKARRQKEWDETKKSAKEAYDQVAEVLREVEQLARAGLPVHVQIARADGQYFLLFPDFQGQPGEGPGFAGVPMARTDEHTLQLADLPPEFPPFLLRLHRISPDGQNELRGSFEVDLPVDGKTEPCEIKWDLDRDSPEAPPPPPAPPPKVIARRPTDGTP